GMFAASELFGLTNKSRLSDTRVRAMDFRAVLSGIWTAFRMPVVVLRGSLLGILVGAVPGVGSSVANLVSYSETKRRDRDSDTFGRGNPRGVAASESANSSSEGGSMVSLFALGIPGGAGTAVLLAAFSMHNITGGPRFLRDQADVVYAVIMANMAQGLLLLIIGLFVIHFLSAIVKLPLRLLIPSVLVMAAYGAFGLT